MAAPDRVQGGFLPLGTLDSVLEPVGVQFEEDEQQYGKEDQARSPIAEKGQGNPNGGQQANDHSYIDEVVEQQYRNGPIAVHAAEIAFLPFRQMDQPQKENREQQYHPHGAHKAPFLPQGTEDVVRVLFRDKVPLGTGTFQKALAEEAPRLYGLFGLVGVVAYGLPDLLQLALVLFQAEPECKTISVPLFKDLLEDQVDR